MRKLDSLILLRALAVLAVCFCHFGHALESKGKMGMIFGLFHEYGKYGVHIFFVLSGFVIPLSLKKSNYNRHEYFRFLWKRTIRLHPSYVIALGLTLIIMYFSYRTHGLSSPETIYSALQSFLYMHLPADNPVFWTLTVEVQYYIFIGIGYILINERPKEAVFLFVLISLLLHQSQISQHVIFFSYFAYFLIGTIGFLIYNQLGSSLLNYSAITVLLISMWLFNETSASITSLLTITFILWYHRSVPSFALFIGEISYSLYLIHFPIGMKFINLMSRYIDPSYKWALFFSSLFIVCVSSWLFYKIIEKPFADLSSKIKYNSSLKSTFDIV